MRHPPTLQATQTAHQSPRLCNRALTNPSVHSRLTSPITDGERRKSITSSNDFSARHWVKKLWQRLHELRHQSNRRDQLLLELGSAKKEAGRAWHLVDIRVPQTGKPVTPETFTFALRRDRLRQARRREGRYLLRSNMTGEDPATLWKYYMRRDAGEGANEVNLRAALRF